MRIKLFVITVLSLLGVLPLAAQGITLRSFELDEYNISGRYDSRRDGNGDLCALIKVQLPVEGCRFEGDIVGAVEYKVNEYWVYVVNNSKRLTVQCPGLETAVIVWEERTGSSYGATGGCVYMLYLDGYQSALSASSSMPVRTGAYVAFSLTPANAKLYIDGSLMKDPVDGKLSEYLSSGRHTWEAQAYGYATRTGSITVGTEKQSVSVALESVMAELTVECSTSGAQVYVNGERKGTGSSWTGSLTKGTYRVEVRKTGCRSAERYFTLGERQKEKWSVGELSAIYGAVDVNYTPVDAEVRIDGSRVGSSPDVFNVIVGKHKVEIAASGYETYSESVTVEEGETKQLRGSLSKAVAQTSSSSSSSSANGHSYVDLGLSVKWATCNVGASRPEDYGYYYAWGETTPKSSYDEENSVTYGVSWSTDISGNAKYDAARANWGGSWRLPTKEECQELYDRCSWAWTSQNGVNGYKVTGPNGKSIFLPAAGRRYGSSLNFAGSGGYYWSSTPSSSDTLNAFGLYFYSGRVCRSYYGRFGGLSVRPVSE